LQSFVQFEAGFGAWLVRGLLLSGNSYTTEILHQDGIGEEKLQGFV